MLRKFIAKILKESFIDSSGNLTNFQPVKEKTKFINYPIDGVLTKFQITNKSLHIFTGKDSSLDNMFLPGIMSVSEKVPMVQVQYTHLTKFVKLSDNIYLFSDINNAYDKFFNENGENASKEKDAKYIEMFRSYLLNDLKKYNHNKLVEQLFNLLEDTGYSFVYYDNVGMEDIYKYGKYKGRKKQIPYVMK